MASSFSLSVFPEDIIRVILRFLPPEDNLSAVPRLSRRFHLVANEPLLWRYYCCITWRYWDPAHAFREKLLLRASSVDWKALWILRRRTQAQVAGLFDDILATKAGQLGRFKQLCLKGYDAKDFLLDQCHTDDQAEDVLSRRYFGNSALDSIHRGIAVETWAAYQGSPVSSRGLDRALGAFDMFLLHDQVQDLDYVTATLDALSEQFLREHSPGFEDLSTRDKALMLVRWLRINNLTGIDHPDNYRNLRNCLIGHALSDKEHPSLPIISSAIFSCLAERLGMTSFCCCFPSHVHAGVYAAPGETLDGAEEPDPNAELKAMYLDPYGSSEEITHDMLRRTLVEFGWTLGVDVFLRPSPVPVIVQRTARNIKATCSRSQSLAEDDESDDELMRLRAGHKELNLKSAAYAAMWAELLMLHPSSRHWDESLEVFLKEFTLSWNEDAWIVEKYLLPLFDSSLHLLPQHHQTERWDNVREVLNMIYESDHRVPAVNARQTPMTRDRVLFKIGQVFRHRRYLYIGVINGWAVGISELPTPHYLNAAEDEEEREAEIEANMIGDVPPRSAKIYYTCLRVGMARLRVSQENIEIITDPDAVPASLRHQAGKFFKRFDRETCTFVSNIKESYPDD
ncbi:hypothetical protein GQ53DRAFT_827620 [Thozetella sp. PMI_491]|nr:hypothetical protein GQ53DRAFT_827620 [Thozetella sp. PMI_491]